MAKRTAEEVVEIRNLIDSTEGRWFRTIYVKRTTGEIREMVCRVGVKAYVNGIGMKYDARSRNLMPVWVANEGKQGADAYRMIDLEGVLELKAEGQHLKYVA